MKWGFSQVAQQLYTTAAQFAEKDRMFADVTELRPDYFRMAIPWSYVAKQKNPGAAGARDWSMVDSSINDALLLGSEIVMQVGLYRPTWGGGWFGFGGKSGTIADFAAFTTECVNRYKPGGPGIRTDDRYAPNAGRGVTIWECWNEQNVNPFWGRNVDPSDYTNHLKAFYNAIKAIQPGAASTVLFGGTQHVQRVGPYLGQGTVTVDEVTFVKKCYAAGAKPYFDALAFHYYQGVDNITYNGSIPGPAPSVNTDCWKQMTEIREEMVTRGDTAKQMWITEVGWSTGEVTPDQQSAYMQTLYAMVKELGYVEAFIIYNVRNDGKTNGLQDGWGAMDYKFNKKPMWHWLRTLSSPSPPRAVATMQAIAPTVTINQPNLTVTPPPAVATAQAVLPVTKQEFSIVIPTSGTTLPPSFDVFGDGLQLNTGVITELPHPTNLPNNTYESGFIHDVPCLTYLHQSRVQISNRNGGDSDRRVGAIVGADDHDDPQNYVTAVGCAFNYQGLQLIIKRYVNGVESGTLAWTNIPFNNSDFLRLAISKPGANYVYSVYKNSAVVTPQLKWEDKSGNPPAGKYIGAQMQRTVAGGKQYGSPGIKGTWTGGDI